MTNDNKEDEQNKDEEQKELSESKPKKLRGTSHVHLGNHYNDISDTENNFVNKSNTCIHCPKCNTTFNSDFEFSIHIRQCNK